MKNYLTHDLNKRFIMLMCGFVLFTAFSAQTFFSRQQRTNLETRLREKASFINNFYAFLIADALIRKDDITLLQVANRLEEDQEITSVVVTDQRGAVRYHRDSERVGNAIDDPALANTLKTGEAGITVYENSGGKALALMTPLKVQGVSGMIGALRIDLTFRHLEEQVTSSRRRFWFVILGSLLTCVAFVTLFVNRWVLQPMEYFRTSLGSINAAMPEPILRETPDDFGKIAASLNQLLLQMKSELQHQSSSHMTRGEQEKTWIQQLAVTLLPGARVIMADKDNRIISDTDENSMKSIGPRAHLLDLITDTPFATLLTSAFQKEGDAARGEVTFQDKSYNAMVLSVPGQQAVVVKTLIALQPNSK